MKKIKRFPTRRIRDWVLIALGFAVIFGSGFAASKILEDPKAGQKGLQPGRARTTPLE